MFHTIKQAMSVSIAIAAFAAPGFGQVFPAHDHVGWNSLPFWTDECTYQQVFAAPQFGSTPIMIHSLAFAPAPTHNGEDYVFDQVRIRLGYTDRQPGELSADLATNPREPMTEVFNEIGCWGVVEYGGSEAFTLAFPFSTPFCYEPAGGNLLVEIYSVNTLFGIGVSYCNGLPDASRAWNSMMFGNNTDNAAARVMFELTSCGSGPLLMANGSCPGRMDVAWSGATPNRPMAIAYANIRGNVVLPMGPCGGTQIGLGTDGLRVVRTLSTGTGSGNLNGRASAGACGGFLQLVIADANPCATSNVAQLP